ncbi:MAG: NF038122 family metalloprotease [Cyanobacteria bacterium P01_F01_bin.150]
MRYSPLSIINTTRHSLVASRLGILAIGLTTISLCPQSVQALEFNFGAVSTLSPEMVSGLNRAGEAWQSVFTDDITIDISVFAQDLQSDSLGSFNPNRTSVSYQDFVSALSNDTGLSPDDVTAISSLPKSNDFDILLNPEFDLLINGTRNHPSGQAGDLTPYVDMDGDCNNTSVRLTTANAKALGLPRSGTSNCGSAPSTLSDGMLVFNTTTPWDFDPTDGIDPDSFDFVGLATQGLGVTLGMVSGVDVIELNTDITTMPPVAFNDDVLSFVSPSDLFRFSADSLELAPLNSSTSLIDWTTGRADEQGQEIDKYFSIDGGQTKIASFSTGQIFGDGNRASSWKADEFTGTYLGIFEPTPDVGQRLFLTENDRRLMDVTGWDLNPAFWPREPDNAQPPNPPSRPNPPSPKPPTRPPNSTAVPEAGHGLGAAILVAIALGRFFMGRNRPQKRF